MADPGIGAERGVSADAIRRLTTELGHSSESIRHLSDHHLAQSLKKLEVPDRARARVEHAQSSIHGDEGAHPEESRARALAQLREMRSGKPLRSVAGIPMGSIRPPVDALAVSPAESVEIPLKRWTPLGPLNIGGRTRAIVIDPTNTSRLFAAGVGGGVWRSTDRGASWTPTDDLMATLAVCSLVMDPTDPNTLYAGTGEGFSNVDALRGDGIFLTTDGGSSWDSVASTSGNANFAYVNGLAVSQDGQKLLAATTTGIFRSIDAAQSWTRVQDGSIDTVAFDPTDPGKAVAGALTGGQAFFSTDAGATWQQASRPTAVTGRIRLCYAAQDASIVYATVQANPAEIWRSTDGGRTYASRSATFNGEPSHFLGALGWYDNVVWAGDPTNANLVIVGGVDLWRSTDGGNSLKPISTWSSPTSAHADQHEIVADPGYDGVNNRRVYVGNDGGVYMTEDVTTVGNNPSPPYTNGWVRLDNGYGVTQFYAGAGHVGTGVIIGGAQDNGTLRYTPTDGPRGWSKVWGGDGGQVASDPSDPRVWYGEYIHLQIFRNTKGGIDSGFNDYICGCFLQGNEWKWKPEPFTIPDARDGKAQFIAPFELDPNQPKRLLGGGMSLWRTNDPTTPNTDDSGPSWEEIKLAIGNVVAEHSITAIAIAQGDSDRVLVAHANGAVFGSSDATASSPTWTQLGTDSLSVKRQCTSLTIDPNDHDVIFATFGGYQAGNLWQSRDGGTTWTDVSGRLPHVPFRALTLHPQRTTWVYLATEVGLFASEDDGTSWSPTNEGPINVACRDLFWMGNKLVCVTHGRGMFEIDLGI